MTFLDFLSKLWTESGADEVEDGIIVLCNFTGTTINILCNHHQQQDSISVSSLVTPKWFVSLPLQLILLSNEFVNYRIKKDIL